MTEDQLSVWWAGSGLQAVVWGGLLYTVMITMHTTSFFNSHVMEHAEYSWHVSQ
jgi:hypothetical protein